MTKHLFLEGPIQTGKSTLLRRLLAPYMNDVGGFSSQRLTNDTGKTIAFRIVSAQDTRLSTPFENTPDSIFRIINVESGTCNNLTIFEREEILKFLSSNGKKLMLLDEIGGVELKNDVFRSALQDLLRGDIPCIGVIKQSEKAASMSSSDSGATGVFDHNLQLQAFLTNECDGEVIKFKADSEETEKAIKAFLSSIFD